MLMTDKLEAGTVWVNNYRATSFTSPFGGFKDSGIGRESGIGGDQGIPADQVRLDLQRPRRAESVHPALTMKTDRGRSNPGGSASAQPAAADGLPTAPPTSRRSADPPAVAPSLDDTAARCAGGHARARPDQCPRRAVLRLPARPARRGGHQARSSRDRRPRAPARRRSRRSTSSCMGASFLAQNGGKKSITVNLKSRRRARRPAPARPRRRRAGRELPARRHEPPRPGLRGAAPGSIPR